MADQFDTMPAVKQAPVVALAVIGLVFPMGCNHDQPASNTKPTAAAPVASPAAEASSASASGSTAKDPTRLGVKVAASSDADDGERPFTVNLEAAVREGSGTPPYTYLWDFGDGTPFGNSSKVTHVYRLPGSFRASIIVTDKSGDTDQDYVDIDVERPGEEPVVLSPTDRLEILKRVKEHAAGRESQR
jgi:PKD repeat protein